MAKNRETIENGGNLIPFKRGETPNPKGRPIGAKNRSTLLKKWMDKEVGLIDPITKAKVAGVVEDEIILALITKARKGDTKAIEMVFDFLYGKQTTKQEIDATVNNDLPVAITVIYRNDET